MPGLPSAAGLLLGLGLLVAAYAKGRSDGGEIEAAAQLREEKASALAVASTERAIAAGLARIEVRHTTIRQTLEREIHEKTVYRDCRHSADGLRAVNAALGSGTVGAGGGELPAADAAD